MGFTLVEILVALAISSVIATALAILFVSTLNSKQRVDHGAQAIENGRYAVEAFSSEAALAGYYGEYSPPPGAVQRTLTMAQICAPDLTNLAFTPAPVGGSDSVPVGIQGFDGQTANVSATLTACLPNYLAGTDAVVVRRAFTLARDPASLDPTTGVPKDVATMYLQNSGWSTSGCSTNVADPTDETRFQLNVRGTGTPGPFTLHTAACPNPVSPADPPVAVAPVRQFTVRIYYVASCNVCTPAADGVPSLKYAELSYDTATSAFVMNKNVVTVTPGVENMHVQYGVDDLLLDGAVDSYLPAESDGDLGGKSWADVIALRVSFMARALESTTGFQDTRSYDLGAGAFSVPAASRSFERKVFTTTIRLNNIAGRRES